MIPNERVIRSPHGTTLSAKSWLTEAPLRMLMNNLDPDVAERPGELVVYGGIGRAARDWPSFDRIVAALRDLEADETLIVQSGKPVGIFRTHPDAPRVLIANSNLVPHWATWDHFHELDRKGLMMYGQMTAGSWIYIGSQGIVQGTYETFVEVGRRHYGGSLAGRWILTGGLGGMGGAQPLAATMAGASSLTVECQPSRIEMRLRTGYLDVGAQTLDEAMAIIERSVAEKKPVSVGLLGNAAELFPEMVARGIRPDVVTDQTSAHDPINGYLPKGWTLDQWERARTEDPKSVERASRLSMKDQVRAMLDFQRMGIPTLDYGNNIRQMALEEGEAHAFDIPGFVPAYIRPRHRPVPLGRAVGRSGGHLPHRPAGEGADAGRAASPPLARHGAREDPFPGLAGTDLLGRPRRPAPAGPRLQRDGGLGRAEGADRDRPRPSRFRLGREPQPRDRGDARRLRRGVRLAAAERAVELRVGGDLGIAAPWRRRGDGILSACGDGDRGGRDARGGGADRARAVERPGDGGDAARRCGV